LEYDPTIPATLEPSQVVQNISAPDVCGFCFFGDVMEDFNQVGRLRKAEGYLTVEMENAEFFVVAQFRGVRFGQILFGGDDEDGNSWDKQDCTTV
jgi:uridine phosphorylase